MTYNIPIVFLETPERIYMLLTNPKSEQDDLTTDQARTLSRLVKEEFQ